MSPIQLLVADPPWPFKDKLPGAKRGAVKHYRLMTVPQICAFELPPVERDAILFLWRVASQPQAALDVARAWGFEPKSEIVWVKTTRTRIFQQDEPHEVWTSHQLHFGMGRSVRNCHETCLIATRGRPKRLRADVRSVLFAPVPRGEDGKRLHSGKPDEFYQLVETMYSGPRADIFARKHRQGWHCIGDQLEGTCASEASSSA